MTIELKVPSVGESITIHHRGGNRKLVELAESRLPFELDEVRAKLIATPNRAANV